MEKKNSKQSINLLPRFPTIYLITLFYFYVLITPVCGYQPSYVMTLNCGSTGESLARGGRKWTGDVGTTFITHDQNKYNASVTAQALQGSPSSGPVPYSTARISCLEFTYSFYVPSGPKFIRLHFYPSLYPELNSTDAFFSVKVGNYTFLSNFSASLTAQYGKRDTIFKEFCINVQEEDQWLNITFIPSSHGFAFVNGIEIVSMPGFLYYRPSSDTGIPIASQSSSASFSLDNMTALETLYRLNVGGRSIPPVQDIGMFRTWLMDKGFLHRNEGIELFNLKIQIKHSEQFPSYLAPDEVYQTARTMGPNIDLNQITNISWTLPVHLGFNYLVRLHFCEFYPQITNLQDREFHIYIDGFTVEEQADVIGWSGSNGAATYRDYVVMLQGGGNQPAYELLVEMHPNPKYRTAYSDTILNGLELFKLSNATWSLAGPNPEPDGSAPVEPRSQVPRHKKKGDTLVKIVVGGSVSGGAIALSLLIFFLVRQQQMDHKKKKSNETTMSSLPSDLCHQFSIADVRRATDNFSDAFLLGIGGFGNVYKGYIINGETTLVAIKRLNPGSQQGAHEFYTEIQMLSKLRHQHLVSLIGYCNDGKEMILVYDYMAHGTLRDHLYKTDNPPLSWKQRLEICIGTAHGLHYLHTGSKHSIIHRDVKTTNILLDEKWLAKVSDFGLSRVGPTSALATHVSTAVKGSIGYMDPEYFLRQQLTEKSDVYSFGVVLFEVLCARPPVMQTLEKEQLNLAEWARHCHQNGKLNKIIDRHLEGQIAEECLKKFGELAVSCVHHEGIKRPSMNDVVWTLEFVLELQQNAEEREEKLGFPQSEENEEVDGNNTIYSSTPNASTIEDDPFSYGKSRTSDSTSYSALC